MQLGLITFYYIIKYTVNVIITSRLIRPLSNWGESVLIQRLAHSGRHCKYRKCADESTVSMPNHVQIHYMGEAIFQVSVQNKM